MYKPSSFPIFFPAKIKKEHTPELSYLFCVLLMRLVCARAAHNCLIVFWTRSEASPRLKLYNLWPRQASRPLYCRPIIMYVLWGLSLDDMQHLPNHNSSSFFVGVRPESLRFQKKALAIASGLPYAAHQSTSTVYDICSLVDDDCKSSGKFVMNSKVDSNVYKWPWNGFWSLGSLCNM